MLSQCPLMNIQAEFQKMIASEDNIIPAIADIEDVEVKHGSTETLILMAIYDGELADKERAFLEGVAVFAIIFGYG